MEIDIIKKNLKGIFTEYWKYLALNAACKLNLFDLLSEKPSKLDEISVDLSLDYNYLELLLNALTEEGFLHKSGEKFYLNEISKLLTENNPESLKYACINWSDEHMNAWQNLDYSIKTGKPAFKHIYKEDFFDYIIKEKSRLEKYYNAMNEYARDDYKDIGTIIDFSSYSAIMDVGGGFGSLTERIRESYPDIQCYLFDLPEVINSSSVKTVSKLKGDFFNSIPKFADALILSRILHDWDDEKCDLILSNCANALDKNKHLFVIENLKAKKDNSLSMLSINQKLMCNSFERSFDDYLRLVVKNGFLFEEKIKLNELQTILKFKRI